MSFKVKAAGFLFVIIILLSVNVSYAQYPGMAQLNRQMNQSFQNQQMQMQMQMTQQMMLNGSWRRYAGQGATYNVRFKDSTRQMVKSFLYYDSTERKNFLVFVDKKFPKSDSTNRFKRIYPGQTLSIAVDNPDFNVGGVLAGLPTDSCWVFQVITGRINVYAKSVDFLFQPKTFSNTLEFTKSSITGIQLKDGPIIQLTKENVLKLVDGDAKAVDFLERKSMYEAIRRYNKDHPNPEKISEPVTSE